MRAYRFHTILAASAAMLALAAPRPAHALDAYADRRGVLVGAAFGGGAGVTAVKDSPFEDRDDIGLFWLGRIGGGLSKELTLDASISGWSADTSSSGGDKTTAHRMMAVAANAFLTEHLFIRGGLGITSNTLTEQAKGGKETELSSNALGFVLGGGIEFFLTADFAGSFTIEAQQNLGGDIKFTGVNGFVGVTYY